MPGGGWVQIWGGDQVCVRVSLRVSNVHCVASSARSFTCTGLLLWPLSWRTGVVDVADGSQDGAYGYYESCSGRDPALDRLEPGIRLDFGGLSLEFVENVIKC